MTPKIHSYMDEYELSYNGFSFKLTIPDYWVKIYRGQKQEPLYNDYCLMLDLLKKVDKSKWVLDIGMNHGLFSVPASMMGYKVFGFEPVAVNVDSLILARNNNDLKEYYDIFPLALSNKNEVVDIYVPECPDNSSFSQAAAISNMRGKDYKIEKVDAVRFDDWILKHPKFFDIGFIKIDTQGAEYIIFEGMKDYLSGAHDVWIVCEYEHHLNTMGHTFKELDDLLISYGFEYVSNLSGNDKIFYKP